MPFLLILTIGLILYGTMYPFNFTADAHPAGFVAIFLQSFKERSGPGDILSNVVLFLPFGFFAMQCVLPRLPRPLRFILVVLLGGSFSLTIERLQIYLPDRVTSVWDLTFNTAGTFFGAIAGWPDWRKQLQRLQASAQQAVLFPVLMGAAWIGYRLFPYVPTIDFQHVKNALKPLFFSPHFPPVDVARYVVVTVVVARLLQALLSPGRALLATIVIPLGVIAAKPFIMTKVIAPYEVAGTLIGLALWLTVLRKLSWRTGIVALLLAAQIAVEGLYPFTLRPAPVMFSFIPFIGFEGGSMAVNLQAFLEKVFLYGSLVWLIYESRRSLVVAVTVSVAFLTAIELVQMYLADRTSEITDPLLALILGLAFYFLDLRPARQRAAGAALSTGASSAGASGAPEPQSA